MILQGKSISPGVARGVIHVVDARLLLHSAQNVPAHGPPEIELERLHAAIGLAGMQLRRMIRQLGKRVARQDVGIFDTHAAILHDPRLIQPIEAHIRGQQRSADAAIASVVLELYETFSVSTSSMIYDKASDILDIGRRLVQCLGTNRDSEDELVKTAVVVAAELTPSEVVHYAHLGARAFIAEVCGAKSHTAILARGLGLPMVVASGAVEQAAIENAEVLVDATRGIVIISPTAEDAATVQEILSQTEHAAPAALVKPPPAITADGTPITLLLNTSDPTEAAAVLRLGAAGIGLFRTEFLYMDRSWWPTEDENFADYQKVAEAIGDTELNLRLADFGAEKSPSYADIPVNRNPSLGLRGIRLLLEREDILKPQLAAIVRIANIRPVTLLLPMLDTLDTLERTIAKLCSFSGCQNRDGLPFRLGTMIELPSAALMIDEIADRVDSLAIGLNDLTQYVLAADRDDEHVEVYHDALQPAVLRLMCKIIEAGNRRGKPVTVCGELAGDPTLTGLLLAFGLRRLSVSRTSYRAVVAAIRKVSLGSCRGLGDEVLRLTSGAQVREFIAKRFTNQSPC